MTYRVINHIQINLTQPLRCLPSSLLLLLLSPLLLFTTAAQAESATPINNHETGRAIYNYRCYFCHGYSGDAKTLASTYLFPPPRDFTNSSLKALDRDTMINAVTHGRPKTGMTSFTRLLNPAEIESVVDFIRQEFMTDHKPNTRYHTIENGWSNHQRYAIAFPFAKGEIPLDTPWEQLSPEQKQGKTLFMESCITCHDRAKVIDEGPVWTSQSLSYPRNNFSYSDIDVQSGASIYASHDRIPDADNLSAQAKLGQALWQQNCAFCHAADGTGKNWIGSFMEPKPRDLTNPEFMQAINRTYLQHAIQKGLRNTSMPAWENVLSASQIDEIIQYISEAFHPVASD